MLNVNVRIAAFTKALEDHIRLLGGFQWFDQWILPTGKIILLDVNHEKSCFHSVKYSRSLTKRSQRLQSLPLTQQDLERLTPFLLICIRSNYIFSSPLSLMFFNLFILEHLLDKVRQQPVFGIDDRVPGARGGDGLALRHDVPLD